MRLREIQRRRALALRGSFIRTAQGEMMRVSHEIIPKLKARRLAQALRPKFIRTEHGEVLKIETEIPPKLRAGEPRAQIRLPAQRRRPNVTVVSDETMRAFKEVLKNNPKFREEVERQERMGARNRTATGRTIRTSQGEQVQLGPGMLDTLRRRFPPKR